jgi:hypothetical protein
LTKPSIIPNLTKDLLMKYLGLIESSPRYSGD